MKKSRGSLLQLPASRLSSFQLQPSSVSLGPDPPVNQRVLACLFNLRSRLNERRVVTYTARRPLLGNHPKGVRVVSDGKPAAAAFCNILITSA